MHDHDPDDAEMRAWLADGKAPHGLCPYCGSTISVTQRDGWFRARCSHRGCGASGPRMRQIGRAVEMLARPPAYVARHMGVHPSSLTDVVSVLEGDRDVATARAEAAEAEVARLRGELDRLRVTTADIETMRQMTEDVRAIGARSEALARQAALREAAGVAWAFSDELQRSGMESEQGAAQVIGQRILAMLDAAPAAEGHGDG